MVVLTEHDPVWDLNTVSEAALIEEYAEFWKSRLYYGDARYGDFVPDFEYLVEGTYLHTEKNILEHLAEAAMMLGIPSQMGYSRLEEFYVDVIDGSLQPHKIDPKFDADAEYTVVEVGVERYLEKHQIFYRAEDRLKHVPIVGVW